ncbi:MAG: hypothetical protein JWN57_1350, partial [Frankiales bacterium]|nr:hypothetical protein [Frankiales bacterium]
MTSTLPRTAAVGEPTEPAPAVVTSLDLLAGGALLVVALAGWVALALAHLGRHSAAAVLALTLIVLVALAVFAR